MMDPIVDIDEEIYRKRMTLILTIHHAGINGMKAIQIRTTSYNQLVKVNDTVKVHIATEKMTAFLKFKLGVTCMIVRGRNTGRVGTLMHVERHNGSFSIITVKDAKGHTFATRLK